MLDNAGKRLCAKPTIVLDFVRQFGNGTAADALVVPGACQSAIAAKHSLKSSLVAEKWWAPADDDGNPLCRMSATG